MTLLYSQLDRLNTCEQSSGRNRIENLIKIYRISWEPPLLRVFWIARVSFAHIWTCTYPIEFQFSWQSSLIQSQLQRTTIQSCRRILPHNHRTHMHTNAHRMQCAWIRSAFYPELLLWQRPNGIGATFLGVIRSHPSKSHSVNPSINFNRVNYTMLIFFQYKMSDVHQSRFTALQLWCLEGSSSSALVKDHLQRKKRKMNFFSHFQFDTIALIHE